MSLPQRAQVVIVGGGIVGASVAYHLTALGVRDVLLLEQGRLSSGTTWHAAGLVGQLRASESGTRLVQYSAALYQRLEAETGLGTGYKECGGVTVARTPERMVQLLRTAAAAEAYNLECEILTPAQAADRYPLLRTDDLQGAIWLPKDGTANPTDVTQSLAKGAKLRGARVVEKVRVTGLDIRDGLAAGVRTDQGDVECETLVLCAGQWTNALAATIGVTVPLHSAEHFYVVTEAIEGVHRMLPILRDPDGYTYVKEEVGGLVVGGFEPVAKPWVAPDQIPYPFEFQLLDEDWEHFEVLMESALHRLPALATTGVKKFYNGPESFTPDNQFILGAAPSVRGVYVAAGFNSVGIASAGGAGRALAEWIVAGEPQSDLVGVDIRRFDTFHGNTQWLRGRVGEVLGLHYAIPWPGREFDSARPFRRSPVHHLTEAAGAVFGSRMGWERPLVFAPAGERPRLDYSWDAPSWQPWCVAEQRATREAVALFDQTSFGKLLVQGEDALTLLQWVCTADVAVPVGRVVYTGVLNSRGGYEADVTLTRVGRDEYLWVTSAASVVRDQDWLRRHVRGGGRVTVTDVTAMYAVLGVMGPRSRAVLQSLSRSGFEPDDFPFATSRLVDLGPFTVRATRMTYVGELGWELYVPADVAAGAYELLMDAGSAYGIVPAGYNAINALRLEKGYRAFGAELGPDVNPVEAGLLYATKLRSDTPFLGREALEKVRATGPLRRVVSLVLADPEVTLWGGELVLRDGAGCGQVTSAAYGAAVGAAVGLASVWRGDGLPVALDDVRTGAWQVNVAGRIVPCSVSTQVPFDPAGEHIHR